MHHRIRPPARRHPRAARLIAVLGTAALLAVAAPVTAADRSVKMTDFDFTPGAVTIARGDTVTWSNGGAAPHDAVGNGWGTSLLLAGQSGSITFQTAGTFAYTCSIHSQMNGTVVVQAASGGGGGGPVATDPPTDTAPAVVTSGGGVPLGGAAAVIVGAAALAGFAAVARRSRHTA